MASPWYNHRLRWLAVSVYALLLTAGSLLPGDRLPRLPDWSTLFSPDKVAHFGAYAVFALLLSAAFRAGQTRWAIPKAVVAVSAFGVLLELLQGVSGTGRSYDPVDMAANTLGALLGGAAYGLLLLLKKRYSATAGRR